MAKGDPVLYGYREGDLVEALVAGKWTACTIVGKHQRKLAVRPLDDRQSGPWTYNNPAHIRRLSLEALETWLKE